MESHLVPPPPYLYSWKPRPSSVVSYPKKELYPSLQVEIRPEQRSPIGGSRRSMFTRTVTGQKPKYVNLRRPAIPDSGLGFREWLFYSMRVLKRFLLKGSRPSQMAQSGKTADTITTQLSILAERLELQGCLKSKV